VINAVATEVERKYLAALAQQMHQVSPIPASSVENAHSGTNVSAQNLIENVDVNLSKLLLQTQRHVSIIAVYGRFDDDPSVCSTWSKTVARGALR
jgi:hypothetical protein